MALIPDVSPLAPLAEAIAGFCRRHSSAELEMRPVPVESPLLDACFASVPWRYVEWEPGMLRYQAAYLRSTSVEILDASVAVLEGGVPIAFHPIFVLRRPEGGFALASNGEHLVEPLVAGQPSAISIEARLAGLFDEHLAFIQSQPGAGEVVLRICGRPGASSTSCLARRLLDRGARGTIEWQLFADLSMPQAEYWSHVRKSYKSLVNAGRRLFRIEVVFGQDPEYSLARFEEFRQLHRREAGRDTRSAETWRLQAALASEKRAMALLQYDASEALVGASLFHLTRDEAYYGVGAYRRDLFEQPIGHVAQVRAIELLREMGVRWYRIGARPYPGDRRYNTDKEIAIGFFKQGFATHLLPMTDLVMD
jgi:FemAB family protein